MPRYRAFTQIELTTILAILVILVTLLLPVFNGIHDNARLPACQSNLKQISLALVQYSQDYDGRWPLAASGKNRGWVSEVKSYGVNWETFRCPSTKAMPVVHGTDYWYNHCLNALPLHKVTNPVNTLLLGEGNRTTDMRYSLSTIPPQWLSNSAAPIKRHIRHLSYKNLPLTHRVGGANYLFADGHIKWLQPEDIREAGNNQARFSFAP